MIIKKLALYLPLLWLTVYAPAYGMDKPTANATAIDDDEIKIVAYDVKKHGDVIQALFLEAFDDAQAPDKKLIAPDQQPDIHADVIIKNEQPLGFAIYEHETLTAKQAFPDLVQYKNSDQKLKILRLNYLAIHKDHRTSPERKGNGLGSRLLNHLKKIAENKTKDVIALNTPDSPDFYAKNGYIKTIPDETNVNCMALPLNQDTAQMLNAAKELRVANKKQGRGLRIHKYFV